MRKNVARGSLLHFIIPLLALGFLLVSCSKAPPTENEKPPAPVMEKRTPPGFDGTLLSGVHTVVLHTSKGDITLDLDADAAPRTVTNFVVLARAGYYDGLTFHRAIPGFMIQGGDPNGDGSGGKSVFGPTFEDEINAASYGLDKKTIAEAAAGEPVPSQLVKLTIKQYYESQGYAYTNKLVSLPMKRGSIAMANRGPRTNGSQFFIIVAPSTPWLAGKHTVFGQVTNGMEIVDAIVNVERGEGDRPKEDVTFDVEVVN